MGLLDYINNIRNRPLIQSVPRTQSLPHDQPVPIYIPMSTRIDRIIFDDNGEPTGYTDELFSIITRDVGKLESARKVNVHDWNVVFPPTIINENSAFIIIEYMVTRK